MNGEALELYGAPVGLYTGKIRCYLRKQGIAYVERLPTDRAFRKEILPAIGRFMNPVIRTSDGTIVQDTNDIIDFLETAGHAKVPVRPAGPRQRLVALALDLYGGEGLVRAAMHYRWSYRRENEAFLRHEFGLAYRAIGMAPEQVEQQLDAFMGYLAEYLPQFGITAESIPAIERAYDDFLAALDAHLRVHPYLLGGQPTCADYGMIAPLWAHLGRDPYPATKMKLEAPSVYRWTERMNACDDDMPEFPAYLRGLPAADEVPSTLAPVLRSMARDYLPELQAVVGASDEWLQQHPEVANGTPCTESPSQRSNTNAAFRLRDITVTTMAPVYTLCMLQRVTDAFDALDRDAKVAVWQLFEEAGLAALLGLKAKRRVARRDFLEVWGQTA